MFFICFLNILDIYLNQNYKTMKRLVLLLIVCVFLQKGICQTLPLPEPSQNKAYHSWVKTQNVTSDAFMVTGLLFGMRGVNAAQPFDFNGQFNQSETNFLIGVSFVGLSILLDHKELFGNWYLNRNGLICKF
jgi:hypothetical protein